MAYEDVPGRLGRWLERYPIHDAKWKQANLLRIFFRAIYGANFRDFRGGGAKKNHTRLYREYLLKLNDYLEQYISEHEERIFTDDLITTIKWMNSRPKPYSYKSVGGVYAGLKRFFSRQPENKIDHRYTVSEMDDEDIRKGLIPTRGEELRDDKPTKAQLRLILEHLSIQHKAFALFVASTGMRPGAVKRILLEDMDLDADPPFVKLRQKRGGKKVPKRVWFSYEARDAIRAWLKVLPTIMKKTGGEYDPKTPLDVSYYGAWTTALKKTGLDEMYEMPRKRQHIYHFYTLRKFFFTNMKNDGMNIDIVNALMGHEGYLADAYDRTGVEKLAEIYLEHMDAVQIYVKDDEIIEDELTISDDNLSIYQKLGWNWKGSASKNRAIIEWKKKGRPKLPVGDEE